MNSNMDYVYGQPKVWNCSFGVNVPTIAAAAHQRHLLISNFHLNKKLTRKAFYALLKSHPNRECIPLLCFSNSSVSFKMGHGYIETGMKV